MGGSAGDGLRFGSTYVYFDGAFHADAASLVVVSTPLAFTTFKTQHFVPTEQRLVVTAADVERRVASEIDGWPATEAYARLVGVDVQDLDPMSFAESPVVVLIDGTNYVRSIRKANADGSLTFFCAIDEGLVLRVARGVDLVANAEEAFAGVHATIGQPQLVIGCDGGEEFLLVLPGVSGEIAVARAEQLRSALAATPIDYRGVGIGVTASFGVATFPSDGSTAEQLIGAADSALYAAKAAGRNLVERSPNVGPVVAPARPASALPAGPRVEC